ncbi:DinB family protein [Schinkia sp. CFF1]
MADLIKKQFGLSRSSIFKTIEQAQENIFDVKPKGYNNTIHWQLGHVLVVAEQFLFGGASQLPNEYKALFGNGTNPSEWKGEVPTVETLVGQLKEQLQRIQDIPNERFQEKLPEQFLGNNTFGELASLGAFHECYHSGQIHAMKRVLS